MRAETNDHQVSKESSWIDLSSKKTGEKIQFIGCLRPTNDIIWPENEKKITILTHDIILSGLLKTRRAYINIKWHLNESHKYIKYIKLRGFWRVNGIYFGDSIVETYPLNITPSKLNKMKDTPSILNLEISNTVKVTREADAIIVTGAKPGENIKVCTIAGAEVNAVVTNRDAVKIKVAKNQVYMVTVGKASYKVSL